MLLRNACAVGRDDPGIEAQTLGKRIERLARYDLRTQLGHEPFVAVGVFDEDVIRSNGLDHGIPEVFETLVVDRTAVLQNQRS